MFGKLELPRNLTLKKFVLDLKSEISDDNVSNGAAALAYYLMLSIFPAAIFLLTLLPYLPIPNLDQAILGFLQEAMPGEAASMFTTTIKEITTSKQSGLLSLGLLLTLWAASNGMYAIMQQLNITYDVKEGRPFWKVRSTALLLTALFGALVIGAFALILFGGTLQEWIGSLVGLESILVTVFSILRWGVIIAALLLGFALTYYFGPDVDQKFRFITPGSAIGVAALVISSLAFRFYVANFGNYNATYGSLGAVIVLMLWLYITGLVILLGSEINALLEDYSPRGKRKGEKQIAA